MNQLKLFLRTIPSWAVMLTVFGFLYLTGLHTEAIGQVQRLLLATGIHKASVPAPTASPATEGDREAAAPAETTDMVGAGFRMTDLNGQVVSFESLRGKVIFLNIWATWCPPCVAEMPNVQRLYEKVGSDKIAFVMLSVDQGGVEKVQKYITRKGYTFPVYLPYSQLPQEFYSPAIPSTFIISPEGKIVARQEGMADYNTPEMREFLQSMATAKK
jgi:thiol-disulfide isomerase/thioredoxin